MVNLFRAIALHHFAVDRLVALHDEGGELRDVPTMCRVLRKWIEQVI